MKQNQQTGITPTREEDYAKWYQNVIKNSELAEISPIRGCMIIKPWGYSIWENIVKAIDKMFKKFEIKNVYFPLFIPLSFMQKEAKHVSGFAKECAIVTHNKLTVDINGNLKPSSPLPEPLIIRPTSEIIIGESFSKWIKSYRDLPILINQWANVVRWEMRTRMFLRTSEFLWQEGHTAHSTKEEAIKQTKLMLNLYEKIINKYLAIPVIKGKKTNTEKFPGAEVTFCIEAMMQDHKALQMGTSHFLGQNFSKASNICFQTKNKNKEFAWTTSWGVSTRLIGGIIMVHGDDNGIMIPPRIAPSHIVLLPILTNSNKKMEIIKFTKKLKRDINKIYYCEEKIRVEIDNKDTISSRNWKWIKKGIPLRIEIGPKEVEKDIVCIKQRNRKNNDKLIINKDEFIKKIPILLDEMHKEIFENAKKILETNTIKIDVLKDFYNFFEKKNNSKIHGGFVLSHWCGRDNCELKIKKELSVTIRCIPTKKTDLDKNGECIICKKHSKKRVFFAKSY